ncbi:MAG TPA: hypothetical protein VKT80_09915, partial [Chloroflexota bacterium]|nr:hypothetical protein [Chloroflexota bacterium]
MTETRRFAVDDLIHIPAQVIATHEILKGTFDDEIKRLTALRDEIAARQGADHSVEKANALLDDAKAKKDEADKALE